jgi:hypothetical protein
LELNQKLLDMKLYFAMHLALLVAKLYDFFIY